MAETGVIDEYYKRTIMNMTERVVVNLTKKYRNIQEGVSHIMVGQVLEYEAKTIRNQALAQGREQGRIRQAIKMYREIAHYSDQQILPLIMDEFHLSEQVAWMEIRSTPSDF